MSKQIVFNKLNRVFVMVLCGAGLLWGLGQAMTAAALDQPPVVVQDGNPAPTEENGGEYTAEQGSQVSGISARSATGLQTLFAPEGIQSVSDDIMAYWKLDEGSGSTLLDQSANSYNISFNTAVMGYTTTVPTLDFSNPYALDFFASGSANRGSTPNLDNLQNLTIALWVNPDTVPGSGIARFITLGSEKAVLRIQSGSLHFYMNIDGGLRHVVVPGVLTAGAWQHVAGTYDGSTMRLYHNGSQVGSLNYAGTVNTGNGLFLNSGGEPYDGKMDDIRIYNRTLSADEIASLYQGDEGYTTCYTEYEGDSDTDFSSIDASALQDAIGAAGSGGTIKIAGMCAGVQTISSNTQTAYITQSLTLQGGYTTTNWLAASDPVTYPTSLDAQNSGRVVYITSGINATLDGLTLIQGQITGNGGGIYNDGTLTVTNSTVMSNTATADGGGIFVNNNRTLTLENSTIQNNTAGDDGGGIVTAGSNTLDISNSLIQSNSAGNASGNFGGGFYLQSGNTSISYTTIQGNTAQNAGGISIYRNNVTIDSSTIANNTGTNQGGGINNQEGSVTLLNSTISQNTGNLGGGILNISFVSGVSATVTLSHTTVVSNSGSTAGGIRSRDASTLYLPGSKAEEESDGIPSQNTNTLLAANVEVILSNSIVAGNGSGPDCLAVTGGIIDATAGYNLDSDGTCIAGGGPGNLTADPQVGPLQDNDGETQTHALQTGSPALDTIPYSTNGCGSTISTDQRGESRPFNGNCDIGAYEYVNFPPVASDDVYTTTEDIQLTVAAPGVLSNDTDANGDVLTATLLTAPANGTLALDSDGAFNYTPDENFNGVDTFTYLASDDLPITQGYWPFEDGSNPTADESGNDYDGTLVNGTTFTSTTPVTLTNSSMALSFDGVDDRVDVTGPINLANQSFTVSFWAKRNVLSGNTDIIFGQGTGGTNVALHIGFRNTNVFTCAFWNNDLNTPVAYTDLNWHHWACTYDASTNQRAIYRDGVLVASDIASADYQGSGTIGIGHRNNGDHFNGLVDDVRLYYGALSVAEVQAAMLGEMPGLGDTAVVTLNVTPVNDPPVAVDDAYTTPQGTALIRDVTPGNLTTTFAHNNGHDGNMFDVTAGTRDVHITAMDIHVDATGSREVAVYYKAGTYAGSEQTPGAWTLLGTQFVDAQGAGNVTSLDLTPLGGLTIPAGQTYGLYVTVTDTSISLRYTGNANTYSNGDLTITTGTGNAYPFGSVFSPRTWNGTIYYEVTAGVLYNDSEVDGESLTASLSTSPGNGVLTFNSDGSFAYTPTVSFFGVDTFTYIASDGALTDTATVSITVTALPCQVEATGDNLTDYASADAGAVQEAVNNASPGDTIKIAGTCAGVQTQNGETQTVYISQTLTLQGGYTYTNWLAAPDPETYPTTLDAESGGRVGYIIGGVNVTVDSLTITGGYAPPGGSYPNNGGGFYLESGVGLTITNSTVVSHTAEAQGGVIYTQNGTAVLFNNSTFSGNYSPDDQGGVIYQNSFFAPSTLQIVNSIFNNNYSGSNQGGVIYQGTSVSGPGSLQITGSTFSGNYSGSNQGGAIYQGSGNTLEINDSTFNGNYAGNQGGAIYTSSGLTMTGTVFDGNYSGDNQGGAIYVSSGNTWITQSTFNSNSAQEGGAIWAFGDLRLSDSAFTNNVASHPTFDGRGGALYKWGGTSFITNTTFISNTADDHGGGIYNSGTLTLFSGSMSENTAFDGSGVYNVGTLNVDGVTFAENGVTEDGTLYNSGTLSVMDTTFSGNAAFRGGGIYNENTGNLEVLNSTFANNQATEGGGIHSRGVMTLTHSTVAGNSADFGRGIHNWNGTMTLMDSIIADNVGNGVECLNEGTLAASLNNLIEDGTCNATLTGDPLLAALGDYGGETQTFNLLPFSPAIDYISAGTDGCGTTITTDQRGFGRPVDGSCDIGAVELDTNYVPVAADDAYTTTEEITLTVTASGVLTNDVDGDWDGLTAVLDTDVTSGTLTLNSDGSFSYTPGENFCGTDSFTYHADDGQKGGNIVTVTLSVICVNDAPVAVDDSYTTVEDTPLILSAPGVLGNDNDVEGDSLTAVLDTTVTTGTLALNSDGSFNYTPPANWFGVTTFTYHANDGEDDSNSATVTLTVLSENDLPVVNAGDDQTADEGEVVSFTGNYIDPGLQSSVPSTQYSVASSPMGGTSIHWDFGDGNEATGTLTPTHTYTDDGIFTVTLTITDTEGGVSSDSLLVTVANVAPTLTDVPDQSVTVGSVVTFTTFFTDPGVLDTHTAVIDWGDGTVEAGTVDPLAMSVSGSHSYTAAGSYAVTVTLTDDDGGEHSQSFTVTVGAGGYMVFLPMIIR